MVKKEFTFYGKTFDEVKRMGIKEFIELIPSRRRRSVERGFTDAQKVLLDKVKAGKGNIETHCRDMLIIPDMVGLTIKVHNGKQFVPVMVTDEMLGHVLGEFALTRGRVMHNAPGIGATKSSSNLSVK